MAAKSQSRGRNDSPAECPVCGIDVPPNSRACPGCGADERTGWNEEATRYDGIDLPESVFDPTEPSTKPTRVQAGGLTRTGIPVFTWIVAFLMLVLIVTLVVLRLF